MDSILRILTQRQRRAWLLREQGLTYAQIGQEMGISQASARSLVRSAENRLRECEQYHCAEERNDDAFLIGVTAGECKLLIECIKQYEQKLYRGARGQSNPDWREGVPYTAQLLPELLNKLQMLAIGRVQYISLFASSTVDFD